MQDTTAHNLKEAFAGESQAAMKYSVFAAEAEKAGLPEVARLFRAVSFAEQVHAGNHLRALDAVGDTSANLKTAEDGEIYEVEQMYPAFKQVAQDQGEKAALRSMHYALEAEKQHIGLYHQAEEMVLAGHDIEGRPVYVCPLCGHTVVGEPPARCPICGQTGTNFHKF